ncbi:MAG: SpoIIE family protein phosphatase [Mariprofundus sp.]|nr:SpoIIE family protein phosphatase [Mariprofundus sp.]
MISLKHRNYPGEKDCGDQLQYWQDEKQLTCCVVDGLGHGSDAKEAACKIIHFVDSHRSDPPVKLFTACDQAMRHERAGVMAMAWIEDNLLTYAAAGNITGYLARENSEQGSYKLEQLNMDRGMIGGGFRKLNVQTLTLSEGDLLIMHSDGLNPFYHLEPWKTVANNSDKLAQMLLEDQSKGTDDACVLVYRHGS